MSDSDSSESLSRGALREEAHTFIDRYEEIGMLAASYVVRLENHDLIDDVIRDIEALQTDIAMAVSKISSMLEAERANVTENFVSDVDKHFYALLFRWSTIKAVVDKIAPISSNSHQPPDLVPNSDGKSPPKRSKTSSRASTS